MRFIDLDSEGMPREDIPIYRAQNGTLLRHGIDGRIPARFCNLLVNTRNPMHWFMTNREGTFRLDGPEWITHKSWSTDAATTVATDIGASDTKDMSDASDGGHRDKTVETGNNQHRAGTRTSHDIHRHREDRDSPHLRTQAAR